MLARIVRRVSASRRFRRYAEAGLLAASSRFPLGTNVFDRDWDLLVLLDTCRYDALRRLEPEFDFLSDVESIWSLGSSTREWTANTLTTRNIGEVRRTAYVCGNGRVAWTLGDRGATDSALADGLADWDTVSRDDFAVFDAVPEYAPHEPYGGLVTPDVVTDRAVAVGRQSGYDRLVVHYITPHNPYRANAIRENRPIADREYRPFDYLRAGGDRDTVWNAYLDELRWGLEHVAVLLANVDADTAVVSADHGDLFGHLGLYSHPTGVPHPALRRVPWMETTATDTGTYEPRVAHPESRGEAADLRDHLAHLGYA